MDKSALLSQLGWDEQLIKKVLEAPDYASGLRADNIIEPNAVFSDSLDIKYSLNKQYSKNDLSFK
jgi:hypothetical protein